MLMVVSAREGPRPLSLLPSGPDRGIRSRQGTDAAGIGVGAATVAHPAKAHSGSRQPADSVRAAVRLMAM